MSGLRAAAPGRCKPTGKGTRAASEVLDSTAFGWQPAVTIARRSSRLESRIGSQPDSSQLIGYDEIRAIAAIRVSSRADCPKQFGKERV